jgi:hypothetical protein
MSSDRTIKTDPPLKKPGMPGVYPRPEREKPKPDKPKK